MTTTGDLLKKINSIGFVSFLDEAYAENCQSGYVLVNSGMKYVSRSVEDTLKNGYIDIDKWAPIIGQLYGDKWQRIFDALALKYPIIENYNMQEEEKTGTTGTETNNTTQNETEVGDTVQNDESSGNISSNNNGTNNSYSFPYDSGEQTPTNKSETHANENSNTSSTGKTTSNGTRTNDITKADQKKTASDVIRTLTRHGNIGVTTNAQMQDQYLRLYNEWGAFVKIIWRDLDDVLTIGIC